MKLTIVNRMCCQILLGLDGISFEVKIDSTLLTIVADLLRQYRSQIYPRVGIEKVDGFDGVQMKVGTFQRYTVRL